MGVENNVHEEEQLLLLIDFKKKLFAPPSLPRSLISNSILINWMSVPWRSSKGKF
jgi:hypothetical protein